MKKNTKIVLSLLAVGVVGYFLYQKSKEKKQFTGVDLLTGMPSAVGRRQ